MHWHSHYKYCTAIAISTAIIYGVQKSSSVIENWCKIAYAKVVHDVSEQLSERAIGWNSEKVSEIDNALKDECQLVEHTE